MRRLYVHLGPLFFLWISHLSIQAQESFICQGDFYLAITDGAAFTTVYTVGIESDSGTVAFQPLNLTTTGKDLNAMGFRSVDNFIYGVDSGSLDVYRVGKDGIAQTVSELYSDPYLQYVAGDITPDGRYLVVIGTSSFHDEVVGFIDLDSPTYEYTEIWLEGPDVRSADVAFDPIDGTLYGFDGINHRLVTYDIQTGLIKADYPPTDQSLLMGGLFFDAFGKLFGYGLVPGENVQQAFYSIDKETGAVKLETVGPPASRNDGCSCPYTLGLQLSVEKIEALPCTTIPIKFEIANSTGITQNNLRLEQVFPESFIIKNIDSPIEGVLTGGGPNANFFTLESLSIPIGLHELIVEVELTGEASGTYAFQAELSGLPGTLGYVLLSDNPKTLVKMDSTIVKVGELVLDYSRINTQICSPEGLALDPGVPGATYLWDDGSTEPTYNVTSAGTYAVTISTDCQTIETSIQVDGVGFEVDLGPNRQIEIGDAVNIEATVSSSPDGSSFSWSSSLGGVSCTSCTELSESPRTDTWYYLTVTDPDGCAVKDSVLVEVINEQNVFFPTAFSPNGDGINDQFFIHSKQAAEVVSLQIFDRWGNLIFRSKNTATNDPVYGWDGRSRGRELDDGVFFYLARLRFLDEQEVDYQGELVLLH
ncbi:MAG: gliding motility-associated C-terminal domain-containing protein [Saprospiraceae bacterium]|nr:gliding motility-associated C-terminal domain-containing protein [Saprospiraceae bacterium]